MLEFNDDILILWSPVSWCEANAKHFVTLVFGHFVLEQQLYIIAFKKSRSKFKSLIITSWHCRGPLSPYPGTSSQIRAAAASFLNRVLLESRAKHKWVNG
jgi:hypothetical protein